ncbi:MAG: hypothetical protein ACJAU6_003401 [Alphaproteobacteria bacterium]|jgi:hypothetical protein
MKNSSISKIVIAAGITKEQIKSIILYVRTMQKANGIF